MIVNSRTKEFVGTKTMAIACKFLGLSLKFKECREMIKSSIQDILFSISLPLFLATEKDLQTFQEDPVEYVRMQVDHLTEYNVKRQLSILVEKICSLKYGKKGDAGASMHLFTYLQMIDAELDNQKSILVSQ